MVAWAEVVRARRLDWMSDSSSCAWSSGRRESNAVFQADWLGVLAVDERGV